jgi:putative transposase
VDFYISLCGKREHRGANRKDLYEILAIEARRRSWTIGVYEAMNWWFKKKWNPLMDAMQRGGTRALDNLLPPILRDYSDLAPFEMLVGDQHRFDRWVVDEDTGEIFRPEGYLWQDLRSRTIYGAAVDRKYDAWLIGLALRLGVSVYGAFGSIYTDNGKPEISRFITAVLANLRGMGMEWERTIDTPADITELETDEVQPCVLMPGTHKKAIVKNAKAKMIEGTFYRLEQIMASRMLLPGQTKKLSDDIHWQDVDHNEAMKLAEQGKLLTHREFIIALFRAINYYNTEKPHSGVLREWIWKPKPKSATPRDCLMACYNEGWRPKVISADAADLIFLARTKRIVNRGRISLEGEQYEADALLELHGERLDIRYNPMTLEEAHIFRGSQYLCTARPVEYSSMIDRKLASRKIAEKRERRKKFAEEFRRISSIAPDFREYSKVPEAERVAALIGAEKKRRALENKEFNRPLSEQEINEHIAKMEAGMALPSTRPKPLPERPEFFIDELTRMEWIAKYLRAGGELNEEDENFRREYMAALTEDQKEFWQYQTAQI